MPYQTGQSSRSDGADLDLTCFESVDAPAGLTLNERQLKLAAISVGVPTQSAQSQHSDTAAESAFV